MDDIEVADGIAKRTERLVLEFCDETVPIFMANHGISKIRNHSDGGTSKPHRMRT